MIEHRTYVGCDPFPFIQLPLYNYVTVLEKRDNLEGIIRATVLETHKQNVNFNQP